MASIGTPKHKGTTHAQYLHVPVLYDNTRTVIHTQTNHLHLSISPSRHLTNHIEDSFLQVFSDTQNNQLLYSTHIITGV